MFTSATTKGDVRRVILILVQFQSDERHRDPLSEVGREANLQIQKMRVNIIGCAAMQILIARRTRWESKEWRGWSRLNCASRCLPRGAWTATLAGWYCTVPYLAAAGNDSPDYEFAGLAGGYAEPRVWPGRRPHHRSSAITQATSHEPPGGKGSTQWPIPVAGYAKSSAHRPGQPSPGHASAGDARRRCCGYRGSRGYSAVHSNI